MKKWLAPVLILEILANSQIVKKKNTTYARVHNAVGAPAATPAATQAMETAAVIVAVVVAVLAVAAAAVPAALVAATVVLCYPSIHYRLKIFF